MKHLVVLMFLFSSSMALAFGEPRIERITVSGCPAGRHSVDGEDLGEFSIALDVNFIQKTGVGTLTLTKDGVVSNFPMGCQPMLDAMAEDPTVDRTYLIHGSPHEFIVCDTIEPVRRNMRYGIPIHVLSPSSVKMDTYTTFPDNQAFSALIPQSCKSSRTTLEDQK